MEGKKKNERGKKDFIKSGLHKSFTSFSKDFLKILSNCEWKDRGNYMKIIVHNKLTFQKFFWGWFSDLMSEKAINDSLMMLNLKII